MSLPSPIENCLLKIAVDNNRSYQDVLVGVVMVGLITISNDDHKPYSRSFDIRTLEKEIADELDRRLSE